MLVAGCLNVRLWLLADIQAVSDLRPLYPRKQTLGATPPAWHRPRPPGGNRLRAPRPCLRSPQRSASLHLFTFASPPPGYERRRKSTTWLPKTSQGLAYIWMGIARILLTGLSQATSAPATALQRSSWAPGAWSIESFPWREVRRSSPQNNGIHSSIFS